jgi:hypothetical protein
VSFYWHASPAYYVLASVVYIVNPSSVREEYLQVYFVLVFIQLLEFRHWWNMLKPCSCSLYLLLVFSSVKI